MKRFNRIKESTKGVTIIALVVTITILLIVAGISLGSITDKKRFC